MNKKVYILSVLLACLLLVFPGVVGATPQQDVEKLIGQGNYTSWHLIGAKASTLAKEQLSFKYGDANVLAMTNASFAIVGGQTTEKCVDAITAISGCTVGKGNLLMVQRSKEQPLWFAFYNKANQEMLYLQVNPSVASKTYSELGKMKNGEIFSIIARENIDLQKSLKDAPKWEQKMASRVFGGNESSLIGIASVWASPTTTYDYLKAAQFHNHICPGITSGYFIIKYLDNRLPLRDGQSYRIIATPAWCKDDAFQVIFDSTVGKSGMHVMVVTDEQKKKLPANAQGIAGLYIRWDAKTGTGDGLVLGYDFDKAGVLAKADQFPGPFSKLNTALHMMSYVDRPEILVTELKQFKINSPAELAKLQTAGNNPLVIVGLMKE